MTINVEKIDTEVFNMNMFLKPLKKQLPGNLRKAQQFKNQYR
jgi:hypothetical protein